MKTRNDQIFIEYALPDLLVPPYDPNQDTNAKTSIGTYEPRPHFSGTPSAINKNTKRGRKFKWHYSDAIAESICALIAEGCSVDAVARTPGYPSRFVIDRWRWEQPRFNAMICEARELRKQFYQEKILEMVEELESGISVSIKQFKFKLGLYRWLSQVRDPGTFGRLRRHLGYTLDTGFSVVHIKPKR